MRKTILVFCLVALLQPAWADEPYPVAARTIVAIFEQAKTLYHQHRYREALDTFAHAESLFPEKNHIWDADTFQWMGHCALAMADYDLADRYYDTAYQKYSALGPSGYTGCSDVNSAKTRVAEERRKHSVFNFDFNKTVNSIPKTGDSFNSQIIDLAPKTGVYSSPFFTTNQVLPKHMFTPSTTNALPTFAPISPSLPSLSTPTTTLPVNSDSSWSNQMKEMQNKIDQLRLK